MSSRGLLEAQDPAGGPRWTHLAAWVSAILLARWWCPGTLGPAPCPQHPWALLIDLFHFRYPAHLELLYAHDFSFLWFTFFSCAGIERRVLHVLGKSSTTEQHRALLINAFHFIHFEMGPCQGWPQR